MAYYWRSCSRHNLPVYPHISPCLLPPSHPLAIHYYILVNGMVVEWGGSDAKTIRPKPHFVWSVCVCVVI